jgi:hypothetical protein
MAFIRLRKANENGEEIGPLIVNVDQIVAISAGQHATEVQMSDGRTRWVKNTPDEVETLAKKF